MPAKVFDELGMLAKATSCRLKAQNDAKARLTEADARAAFFILEDLGASFASRPPSRNAPRAPRIVRPPSPGMWRVRRNSSSSRALGGMYGRLRRSSSCETGP